MTTRARILVVDDEELLCRSLRRMLGRDYDVVTTSRAVEALEYISAGVRFDAILCDMRMPETTGVEFHARLREIAPDQAARVVFMSGAFTSGAAGPEGLTALTRGPVLAKPFDKSQLHEAISYLDDNAEFVSAAG